MPRGYFAIGIFEPKIEANEGVLMRSAFLYEAAFVFTIGSRYTRVAADTPNTQLNIPLFNVKTFDELKAFVPTKSSIVGVELSPVATSLPRFKHPDRAIYLLGAEDHGLTEEVMNGCDHLVQIPTPKPYSMNVSVAGSILMYDRMVKG